MHQNIKITPLKKALMATHHFIYLNKKSPKSGLFQYQKLSLFTQIHFSSRVQFVELVVFQIINKQNAFSC